MGASSRRSYDWMAFLFPLMATPLNDLYHQFFCVTGPDGTLECFGKRSSNGAPFGPGAQSRDVFSSQRCDAVVDTSSCYESCMYEYGRNDSNLGYYSLGMRDCQEYARFGDRACRQKCGM
jgi:hypothetical protein